eukprot:TRINITY_DN13051_c0_g1_i3.p1 TRINITY_DN13051_c0_g1~~TRINITY_DN13051_c0_g1_i3.p1  ORF type:complete len:161 (+),score=32.09 TRINITY_DN13051_c0_g1_i3:146-628(+)
MQSVVLGGAQKRLVCDFKNLRDNLPEGISAAPKEDNLFTWEAVIFGPEDTPWEGGIYRLELKFPNDYPNRPPTAQFITEVFHPNVFDDGHVCVDILRDKWTPVMNAEMVLISIQSLLNDPNPKTRPDYAANCVAAKMFVENRKEYNAKVRACAKKSLEDV